jgi:hypothetical protein
MVQHEERDRRGFHHHAGLCIGADGFLLVQCLQKARQRLMPSLPKGQSEKHNSDHVWSLPILDMAVQLQYDWQRLGDHGKVEVIRSGAGREQSITRPHVARKAST